MADLKKILELIKSYASVLTAVAGAVGIVYGVITFLHKREDKINNSITQKEVLEIVKDVNANISEIKVTNHSLIHRVDSLSTTLDKNMYFFKNEWVNHIRKDKNIPDQEKLDDILRIVQGIQTDVKKN